MSIVFVLPAASLVPPNKTLRMVHWQRSRMRKALSWEVLAAIGRHRPAVPIARARILVERHAPRLLDEDNMVGSLKHLLDVLQPLSKRHPSGLGVIASDAPAYLQVAPPRQVKCPSTEAKVVVMIDPI